MAITTERPAATTAAPGIDPITAEVIRGSMETVCYEMATHVSLAATTPILNQSNERNATVMNGEGLLAALSVGIPQFMLSSTLPVRFALDFFGRDNFHEGDVFVANDPYHGGGHLPDYNIFSPVVVDGEVVLIPSIQCHHADTGGMTPGGYPVDALDIWAEGFRIPVIKLYERGVERRDLTYLLRTNCRTPTFIGDLRAQVGAAQLGARRLTALCQRYGVAAVKAAVHHAIDVAARRFHEEVASWPDGVYQGDAWVDHDPKGNRDIHVHVAITVSGDKLTVDFTGSDTRQNLSAYSTFGNTRGYVVAQIASAMDPSIPKNEGFFASIDLRVPEGTCINPAVGRPVAAGTHHPGSEIGEAIALALAQAIPERVVPQVYKLASPIVSYGKHPDTGKFFIDAGTDTYAGWCGAGFGTDGWGARNANSGNLIRSTAEINETLLPQRRLSTDLITDSGGPGRWRGHCGSRYVKQFTAPVTVNTWIVGVRHPVPGVAGGKPGAANRLMVRALGEHERVIDHTAFNEPHEAGEALILECGGGGGWGDPLDRDPEAVRDDVLDEYVSAGSAEREYGVALIGSIEDLSLRVDVERTRALRDQLRAQRSGEIAAR
ncbi:MAG: hydantoinase B/oxoprolinase family protein [Chloroflexi bacterium]|nr:MAG: hydantoinase B/oxoprolinase family protein [Chloroflexota bacterium]